MSFHDRFEGEDPERLKYVPSSQSPATTVLDAPSPDLLPTLPETTLTQLPDILLPVPTRDAESPTLVDSPEQPLKRIKLVDVWCARLSCH